jgi:uncharacterized membrane protein
MRMVLIWIGVLLIFGGLLYMAARANWGGRFDSARRAFSARGFGLTSNMPGLAMAALGVVLMIAAAAF